MLSHSAIRWIAVLACICCICCLLAVPGYSSKTTKCFQPTEPTALDNVYSALARLTQGYYETGAAQVWRRFRQHQQNARGWRGGSRWTIIFHRTAAHQAFMTPTCHAQDSSSGDPGDIDWRTRSSAVSLGRYVFARLAAFVSSALSPLAAWVELRSVTTSENCLVVAIESLGATRDCLLLSSTHDDSFHFVLPRGNGDGALEASTCRPTLDRAASTIRHLAWDRGVDKITIVHQQLSKEERQQLEERLVGIHYATRLSAQELYGADAL